jgi:hypothetical protein
MALLLMELLIFFLSAEHIDSQMNLKYFYSINIFAELQRNFFFIIHNTVNTIYSTYV